MIIRSSFCGAAIALGLTGCSSVYTSPGVHEQAGDATNVRVLAVSGQSVLLANRSPYQPRTLPTLFSTTTASNRRTRDVGALPAAPFAAEVRPGNLELRPPPPITPGPYKIGVGDVLIISTPSGGSSIEELSGLLAAQNRRQGYTVQDDGAITIPDVGRIAVADLILSEAEAEVFNILVQNQIEPSFSIEVAEFNSQRVSVGGAVGAPAVLPITLIPLTLEQALTGAGGISLEDQEFASVRLYRDGTLYQIPLKDFYESNNYRNTRLIDGDSVFVDTEFNLERAESYFQQQISLAEFRQSSRVQALNELQTEITLHRGQADEARSNFQFRLENGAIDRDYVYIAGEVSAQSRYPLPFGQHATLADALYDGASGIPTTTGDLSQIYVLRASTDPREFGAVTAWHLDAGNAVNLVLASRFELRPDDVIFVAEQPITRWNRVIQQITPSLIASAAAAAR